MLLLLRLESIVVIILSAIIVLNCCRAYYSTFRRWRRIEDDIWHELSVTMHFNQSLAKLTIGYFCMCAYSQSYLASLIHIQVGRKYLVFTNRSRIRADSESKNKFVVQDVKTIWCRFLISYKTVFVSSGNNPSIHNNLGACNSNSGQYISPKEYYNFNS